VLESIFIPDSVSPIILKRIFTKEFGPTRKGSSISVTFPSKNTEAGNATSRFLPVNLCPKILLNFRKYHLSLTYVPF